MSVGSYAERFPPPERAWTPEYANTHVEFVSTALDDQGLLDLFRTAAELPERYGVGFDERVVEWPWLLANGLHGRTLDAGSVLNHEHVITRVLRRVENLHVVTLKPEEAAFNRLGVSYVYADLRDLPYRDGYFDTVASISTLEHVGMDNSLYGVDEPRAADPEHETARAVVELYRVLAPRGRLLLSVPYGVVEDHGWFRQFGQDDVGRLIAAVGTSPTSTAVYEYSRSGWQLSDLESAADARYNDPHADDTPAPDGAAAARAVVCLRFDA
jgi:SAM-dependent methyltransferase